MSIKSVSLSLYGLPLPPTPAEAMRHGSARYWSNSKCIKCDSREPIRYVDGDACFGCAMREYKEGLFYAQNDPTKPAETVIPTSPSEAHAAGLDYYFTGNACKGGNHAEKRSTVANVCLNCDHGSPRQVAIAKGESWYMPKKACKKCHTRAERHVNNGTCKGCTVTPTREESPSVAFMRECPDIVISRADAKALGFKVYRTGEQCARGHDGFRYISTGGCLECKG